MDENPWLVESLQDFSFLKCPECTFNTQEEGTFEDHATENHPLSFVLFGKTVKEEIHDPLFQDLKPVSKTKIKELNEKFFESIQTGNVHLKINHVESLQEEIRYNCSMCDKSFTQIGQLNAHIKAVHEKKNPKDLLNDQIKKEKKKIKSLKCLLCGKTFSNSSHLKVHTESVHEGIKVICPICGIATSSKDGLKKHHRTVHLGIKRKENNKKNMCPICAKMLTCSLKVHIEMVHEGKKPFSCEICGISLTTKGALKIHTQMVHEKLKPNKCYLCESSFFHKGDLSKHIEAVHEGKRPFKCNLCDQAFKTKPSRKVHVQVVHEKDLPFACNECDKCFGKADVLKRHIVEVHEGFRKTFLCNLCGKSLCSNQQLKRHVSTIHGVKMQAPPGPPESSVAVAHMMADIMPKIEPRPIYP